MQERYLLAPSILAADFSRLGAQIDELEAAGADWVHVDVMDGHFVPNLSMGPAIVAACRRITQLPLDVHLMVVSPERWVEPFADAGADHLTVHIEATPHIHRVLESIRQRGLKAGVSLNPGTPAETLGEVLGLIDLVLVMTVNPGHAGQEFIPEALEKMRLLRRWQQDGRLQAWFEVDGGISAVTAPLAAAAGAHVFVASKAIFGHPGGIRSGVEALREALESVEALTPPAARKAAGD
ncbi:MAG: ribulose-phosphate 3-epimerase [Chloroflexota bacterium]